MHGQGCRSVKKNDPRLHTSAVDMQGALQQVHPPKSLALQSTTKISAHPEVATHRSNQSSTSPLRKARGLSTPYRLLHNPSFYDADYPI